MECRPRGGRRARQDHRRCPRHRPGRRAGAGHGPAGRADHRRGRRVVDALRRGVGPVRGRPGRRPDRTRAGRGAPPGRRRGGRTRPAPPGRRRRPARRPVGPLRRLARAGPARAARADLPGLHGPRRTPAGAVAGRPARTHRPGTARRGRGIVPDRARARRPARTGVGGAGPPGDAGQPAVPARGRAGRPVLGLARAHRPQLVLARTGHGVDEPGGHVPHRTRGVAGRASGTSWRSSPSPNRSRCPA